MKAVTVWSSIWIAAVMAFAWGLVFYWLKPENAAITALVVFLVMFGVLARSEEREE